MRRRSQRARLRWGSDGHLAFADRPPTPADLAASVWIVTYTHPMGTSLITGPVLAFDALHARELSALRMAASGRSVEGLLVRVQPARIEARKTALLIEGAEEWQDRQRRYADRQAVTE